MMLEKRGRDVFVCCSNNYGLHLQLMQRTAEAGKRHFKAQMGLDSLEMISVVARSSLVKFWCLLVLWSSGRSKFLHSYIGKAILSALLTSWEKEKKKANFTGYQENPWSSSVRHKNKLFCKVWHDTGLFLMAGHGWHTSQREKIDFICVSQMT